MSRLDHQRSGKLATAISGCWALCVLSLLLCGFLTMVPPILSTIDQIVILTSNRASPTETAEPTRVRVAELVPVTAKVIEERVNVRAMPKIDAEIVGKLEKGDQITLIEQSPDGKWYRILSDGETGRWILGEVIEITVGDPAFLPKSPSGL